MSGQKRIVYNLDERLTSTDLNNAQIFGAYNVLEMMRRLYNDYRPGFFISPGLSIDRTGTEAPAAADVLGGLLVRVDNPTSLLIDPGVMVAYSLSVLSADDSNLFLCADPGIQTTGVLNITPNGSGSARIDVIECSVFEQLIASSSRDIYDPSTGLFSPATVDKVRAGRLAYRIRTGTAGSGFPGTVAGWVPLAVALVPAGATTFATCDFWDVRPLVSDRVQRSDSSSGTSGTAYAPILAAEHSFDNTDGYYRWSGYADSVYDGYVAGGNFAKSTGSLSNFGALTGSGAGDGPYVAYIAENQSATYAAPTNGWICLAAIFPGGLPRWVRYVEALAHGYTASTRTPAGPRGILVITNSVPTASNLISSPLPTNTGFGATSYPGVCLAMTYIQSSTLFTANCVDGFTDFNLGPTLTAASFDLSIPRGVSVGQLPSNVSEVVGVFGDVSAYSASGYVSWTVQGMTVSGRAVNYYISENVYIGASGSRLLSRTVRTHCLPRRVGSGPVAEIAGRNDAVAQALTFESVVTGAGWTSTTSTNFNLTGFRLLHS